MADINALLARGVGPAMLEGAHAGYFNSKMQQEAANEQRRLASQQSIPAAMQGDQAALADVMANDPKAAELLAITQQKQQAAAHQKHIDAIDWSGRAADTMLKAAPAERAAVWQQLYRQGVAYGHITPGDGTPDVWSPAMEGHARTVRDMAPKYIEQQNKLQLEDRKDARKSRAGGVNTGGEFIEGAPAKAPGPQSSVAPAGPGNVQTAAYVPPAPTAGQFTPPDANMNVAPPSVPPQDEPDVIRPGLPPPPQVQQAGTPPPPPGHIAMGYKGNPAVINGQPVFHNPETGAWQLGAEPDRAALSSGATADQVPGGGLPGPQMAQASGFPLSKDAPPGAIVGDDPALAGGKRVMFRHPNGDTEHKKGASGGGMYQMPDGRRVEYNPHLKSPQSSALGITPENENLKGEEFIATLPRGDQNIVRGLGDGSLLLQDLSKRAVDYNRYLALAKQAFPDFDPSPGGARRRFEQQFMTSGQGGQTVLAANTAIDHMKTYRDLMEALGNKDVQLLNTAVNTVRRQFGDAAATNPEIARAVLGTEIAKAVRGAGSLNEKEEEEYKKILSTSQSFAQSQGTLNTLSDLLMGRVHALEDRAKGLGVPDSRVNGYLSPRARESLDYIKSKPIGGGGGASGIPQQAIDRLKANPGERAQFEEIFGPGSAAKALGNGR